MYGPLAAAERRAQIALMTNSIASRNVGSVPVQLGHSTMQVPVVEEAGARTRVEITDAGVRIVISAGLDADRVNTALTAIMPTLVKTLAQRFLN